MATIVTNTADIPGRRRATRFMRIVVGTAVDSPNLGMVTDQAGMDADPRLREDPIHTDVAEGIEIF